MTDIQQGDVLLIADVSKTGLEFSIESVGGVVTMTGDFRTAAALSLFGGNDDGSTYWGDLIETQSARMYPSKTLKILRGLPATSANLLKLEDAARSDLAWFQGEGIANRVNVLATIPALNRVKIQIDIEANGAVSSFSFIENWKAAA